MDANSVRTAWDVKFAYAALVLFALLFVLLVLAGPDLVLVLSWLLAGQRYLRLVADRLFRFRRRRRGFFRSLMIGFFSFLEVRAAAFRS